MHGSHGCVANMGPVGTPALMRDHSAAAVAAAQAWIITAESWICVLGLSLLGLPPARLYAGLPLPRKGSRPHILGRPAHHQAAWTVLQRGHCCFGGAVSVFLAYLHGSEHTCGTCWSTADST
jgi:hypothetical protein